MKTPYPHQQKMIDEIRQAFRAGSKAVAAIASPRFGKTVVSSNIIHGSQAKGTRVIFCVHRDNLIKQTANTFLEDGIDFGYIKSGLNYDPSKKVHIASVQTLTRWLDVVEVPNILFCDEMHLYKSETYSQVVKYFQDRGTLVIGLTGTPWRLDGKSFTDIFDTMVLGPTVRWLIDNRYLADFHYYAPSMDTDLRSRTVVGSAVSHYKKICPGKLAIAYCVDVNHSKDLCRQFVEAGVRAVHIDGSMPKKELAAIYKSLGNKEIDVICSVDLITTGFDLSAQVGKPVTVECVILLRKTKSLSLFIQMVMRCMTKQADGGKAYIIDMSGNVMLHGLPDDAFDWSLEGRAVSDSGGKSDGVEPPIICEECFQAVVKPVPDQCPHCDAEMKKQKAVIKIIEGELQEIKEAERLKLKEKLKQEEREAKTLNDMILVMQKKGSKNPVHAAKMKMQGRAARQARFKR